MRKKRAPETTKIEMLTIRIDSTLKERLFALAKADDRTATQLVTKLVREYVARRS